MARLRSATWSLPLSSTVCTPACELLGNRFTLLGTDTPIGFFFEALYQTGFYWRFIGLAQVGAAVLLLWSASLLCRDYDRWKRVLPA